MLLPENKKLVWESADGYEVYNTALAEYTKTTPENYIINVGCLALARRRFFDAAKVSNNKSKSADEALKYVRDIYRKETEQREENSESGAFVVARKKLIVSILNTFHEWLLEKAQHVSPSLALGKAVNYTLGQWEHITAYIDCPGLMRDNNASENAIRSFVPGRKNWLSPRNHEGACSSCIHYSLIERVKENGLNPQEFQCCVFECTSLCRNDYDWQRLMPLNARCGLIDGYNVTICKFSIAILALHFRNFVDFCRWLNKENEIANLIQIIR